MNRLKIIITLLAFLVPTVLFAQDPKAAEGGSVLGAFAEGLGWGLAAVLSPCLYAMFPITVSFFLKRSSNRAQGIKNALIYSFCIIFIFTFLGVLLTVLFGKNTLLEISSSAVFNAFVFLLFVVFGISFLGAFEITVPASWVTRVDSKSGMGNFTGIFFMAMTLVLVSFSCTLPFFTNALTGVIQSGNRLAPAFGLLGFSTAIALPFALFAFFPSLLNKVAKSGGWLNSLKVSFGFIELAMALKFLSNLDLQYHWGILDREVYLAIWIIIFGLLGFYLLGKLKFKHDDDLPKNDYGHPYLSVTRFFFAVATLSFTVYMIPGLWGAPLNGISGWLPENKTQDFNIEKLLRSRNTSNGGSGDTTTNGSTSKGVPAEYKPKKYTDILQSEIIGVETYFDMDEALAAAKATNRPIMVDFTGHACANCRKMESAVLSKEEVSNVLHNDFIVASLYVDEKTKLPDNEVYTSTFDGSRIKTIGQKNLDYEAILANSNAQPLYIFLDQDGKIIKDAGGYEPDIDRFLKIMEEVKAEHKRRFP
jgi:cytochrome c biogenesis protein CcdA/thioredoxin-related protein